MKAIGCRFAADASGATAVEYSMLAAGVAGAVMVAVYTLGGTVETNFYGKLVGNWK
ncbi:MAG: Flp family type IVb pilin [Phreatobacter sp.]|nr:Flp family type IVb pilin [Phreatobacter sp.]MBL8568181.1 Flp family type IVb pilin [Phreatobacter sp.]